MDFADAQKMIQQNNEWSAQQAAKQMDFQREMSNTAHVREIEDLKAAGLNPVLSAKLGGASTPSGAMGDTDTSGTSTLIQLAMQTASAAGSAARAAANATERTGSLGEVVNGIEQGIKFLPKKWQPLAYGIVKGYDFLTNHTSIDLNNLGSFLKSTFLKTGSNNDAKSVSVNDGVLHDPTTDWMDKKTNDWDVNGQHYAIKVLNDLKNKEYLSLDEKYRLWQLERNMKKYHAMH